MRVLFTLVFLAGHVLLGADEAELRRQVKYLISEIETPPARDTLSLATGDIQSALIEIAGDEYERNFVRARALYALRFYPSQPTFAAITQILDRSDMLPTPLSVAAIRSFARAFGENRTEDVTSRLGQLLERGDPILREVSVEALADLPGDRVTLILIETLNREEDAMLREKLRGIVAQRRVD